MPTRTRGLSAYTASLLTRGGRDKMGTLLQAAFSHQFCCMDIAVFLFKFH